MLGCAAVQDGRARTCTATDTQPGNPWAQLWALGLIVVEASLCVHTSTAGWILLAQAARANNRLTHSHCHRERVCACACVCCRNVTKQLSLYIYWEDVLMLKGRSTAAMLLFIWLALYSSTPTAAAAAASDSPPLHKLRVVWLSFFYQRC